MNVTGSTKSMILNYMNDLTQNFDFTQVSHFTASSIAKEMHISRSLASQYLNELVKEKLVMKINSRPVYFLHRQKMEELFHLVFQNDDFYDLEEVKQYINEHSVGDGDYSQIIGYDKSLAEPIKQLREAFEYPPSGLPIILYGAKGTGKRTLSQVIYENAARRGKINENAKVFKIEFTPTNSDQVSLKIFGDGHKSGLIDQYDYIVFILAGAQYMSESFQEKLCHLIEIGKSTNTKKMKYLHKTIRYIFLSDIHPHHFMVDCLFKNIPVLISLPLLKEKSKEEIEELIIHFMINEGRKMNKIIKVSSSVLRALVNGDYSQNLIGLQSAIQIMCASALKENTGNKEVIIHTYHLPEYLLRTLPIVTDEDIVYIDTTAYKKSDQIDFILDYFSMIVKSFFRDQDFQESLKDAQHHFDLLSDFLSYKQRVAPERIKGIEISLSNIFDTILKKRYMNLPSGFSYTFAKLMYMNELYHSSINKWQQRNRFDIDNILTQLKEHCINETLIVEEMIRLVNSNLETDIDSFFKLIMIVNLNHYNTVRKTQKIFGIIICHGYSTATSIAEAVNSLLENYIFDAVDMPLDVTIDEIKEILVERINRMYSNADVIVMVDMGSLELLGKSLSTAINCNVGVINNVSTRLALNVGNAILNENNMKMILEKVSAHSMAKYTIVKRQKKDAIIFTSESGIQTAQRMRELFENSLSTKSIPVDFVVCDYNQLISSGQDHEIFNNNNVLFITGTANPHVNGQKFVALEDIISGHHIDIIMKRLSSYLNVEELDYMISDLRKNFTLLNVVGYLTILNPQVLLDNVSAAMDVLQDCLQEKFDGKTLIGLYIHVCCLIERLVTKTAITEFDDLENFEKTHMHFIKCVHEAFHIISKRYNIVIPTSEIAYLYEFIDADHNAK